MKTIHYILATMLISATALVGCSDDDDVAVVTPSTTPTTASAVVDLGLPSGTLWASANLGAANAEDEGYLYAWGETYTKANFSASNYFDPNSMIVTSDISGTQYDAAKAALGDDWLMPTELQFHELFTECQVTRTTINEKNVLKLVGPNEKVLYLPEITGNVEGAAALYDTYLNEKDETSYAKFENVYASYWTGNLAQSDALNANQYAVQMLFVEHAKDAVKKGGALQYGDVYYSRSRLVGAPIRPVKVKGGTPVAEYVNITGKWAQADASGTPLPLSQNPVFFAFEGTNFNGEGVMVAYGTDFKPLSYSRDVNQLTLTFGDDDASKLTVAQVSAADAEQRVISFTGEDGKTVYFVPTVETASVPVSQLAGKWDFTFAGTAFVLNVLDEKNCVVTNGSEKVNGTFSYRFGCFAINCNGLVGTFAVEATAEGSACPFQFKTGDTVINFVVHPKSYETIYSWNGVTDATAPAWLTLNSNNSIKTGSDIKAVTNLSGETYLYAIRFNASWPKDGADFSAQTAVLAIEGGFKTGDRIRVKGYTNADGKTGGLKVWANADTQLGTTSPAVNDFKANETVMNKESVFIFAADVTQVYLCREAGTGTFITDILIDREKED